MSVSKNISNWIDVPVMRALDHFNGMIYTYMDIALQLAAILATVGIIWNCIQICMGTQEVRKWLGGMIGKWVLFLLCMSLYPGFARGIAVFSRQMSEKVSGNSINKINEQLAVYMKTLQEKVKASTGILEEQRDAVQDTITKLNEALANGAENQAWKTSANRGYSVENVINAQLMSNQRKLEQLDKEIEALENDSQWAKKINAIKTVLIVEEEDQTEKYFLDLAMKDAYGNDTGWLSPNSMVRVSLLASDIMWEQNWEENIINEWNTKAVKNKEKRDKMDESKLEKKRNIMNFPLYMIFDIILCFIARILIVVTMGACIIQYTMTIAEYTIISGIAIILIPMLLFDGLKDFANKIIPALFQQAMKLIMIQICMFFCVVTFLDLMRTSIAEAGFDMIMFAYVFVTCTLCFVITSNAPKIAASLMTGQPQLSMGEVVQAVGAGIGAMAAGNRLRSQAFGMATGTAKGVGNAAGSAMRFGQNLGGDIAAMRGAYNKGVTNSGGSRSAGFKAAAGEFASRTGRKIQGGLHNIAHYTPGSGGRGGGGSSGGGSNRFDSTKTGYVNNPLSVTPDLNSMNFGNAKNADVYSGKYTTNMTYGEYLHSQYDSSRGTANRETAKKAIEERKALKQQMKQQKNSPVKYNPE